MAKIEYPKFLYHKSKAPVVVADKNEHKALGAEWKEHPDECKKAPAVKAAEPIEAVSAPSKKE